MKVSDILQLDYREKENIKIIKTALCKIKPLAKYEDAEEVPLEKIEKVIDVLTRKYNIKIGKIDMVAIPNEVTWYQAQIIRVDNLQQLGNCYGLTIYETLAKVAIKMYSDIKTKNIPVREER